MENKRRNFKKLVLRIILAMFLITFLLGGVMLGYVYFIRRDRTVNNVIDTEIVEDNSISKAEAEQRNLDNVVQTPRDIKTLTKDFNVSISLDTTIQSFVIAKGYEVTKDLKLNKTSLAESYSSNEDFAPIFYINLTDAINFSPDITALSSLILTELNTKPYKMIYLDTSFTYIKDFNTLLANLKNSLTGKETKLGLYLYPRWGKEVDYANFLQVTNNYHQTQKLGDIVSKVDEVIIELYGFSNEYSILPANIAPVEWAKKVVAFTAQEVSDKSKVFFEINSNYYLWPEREFTDKVNENYSVIDEQAEIVSSLQFDLGGYVVTSSTDLASTKEVMKSLEIDNNKYISISPKQENIDSLIAIVASYGFPGYIIK